MKRLFKLNNNDTANKHGDPGYDPAYKYDVVYCVVIDNCIALTKAGSLDLTGDETTWPHQGYGERGSNIVSRIMKNPGVSKGGQTVLVGATNRICPYWYQHRHKLTPQYGTGFTAEGPAEVHSFIDAIDKKHAVGRAGDAKKIFALPTLHTMGQLLFRRAELLQRCQEGAWTSDDLQKRSLAQWCTKEALACR